MTQISQELKNALKVALAKRRKDVECENAFEDVKSTLSKIFEFNGKDEDDAEMLAEYCMEDEIFMTGTINQAISRIFEILNEEEY
jgi:hypothetical protein